MSPPGCQNVEDSHQRSRGSRVDGHKNCAMAYTSEYADLKAAVRTQSRRRPSRPAVRDAEGASRSRARVVRAGKTQSASARRAGGGGADGAAQRFRQRRRMAARSTEDVRAEADASAAERIAERRRHTRPELATLRAAARDVQDAREEGEARRDAARRADPGGGGVEAERDALRAAARDERRQHAARLRVVIESEATQRGARGCSSGCRPARRRSSPSAGEIARRARGGRNSSRPPRWPPSSRGGRQLDAAADDRAADADDHADALAHAEAELDALRAQCRRAQRGERARRKKWSPRSRRARDAIAAAADAHRGEGEFDREIGDLRMELGRRAASSATEAAMAAESAALLDAAFGEPDASFDVVVGQSRGQLRDRRSTSTGVVAKFTLINVKGTLRHMAVDPPCMARHSLYGWKKHSRGGHGNKGTVGSALSALGKILRVGSAG